MTSPSGSEIKAGDKVVLWYVSGNRDEDVFTDPFTFDIPRNPNPHIAFGGGGPHFCMGAALARTMLESLLTEVYTRIPDIDAPEPDFLVPNFINGIKRLPATWTPDVAAERHSMKTKAAVLWGFTGNGRSRRST